MNNFKNNNYIRIERLNSKLSTLRRKLALQVLLVQIKKDQNNGYIMVFSQKIKVLPLVFKGQLFKCKGQDIG